MAAVITEKVRFSFLNVFTPRAMNGGEPKYSVTLLIPKSDTVTKQKIDAAIQQVLQEGLTSVFKGQMPTAPAVPIYDGDGVRPNGEEFGEECKGHWVLRASSKLQPGLVDANTQPIMNQAVLYSGCYGRADINFFPYNQVGKKGVGCGLNNLQKLEDGPALSGRKTAQEVFGVAPATQRPYQPITTQPVQSQPQYGAPMQTVQPNATSQQTAINPITGQPYNV